MRTPLPTKITLSPKILFREVDGEGVLLDLERGQYYALDQVGTRLWQLLANSANFETVRDQMLAEYEVDQEELEQDLADFIALLSGTGLVKINT